MKKSFAITLFCLATAVYGTILFIAKKNNTAFFSEINNQMIRVQGISKYSKPLSHAKELLSMVAGHDTPPADWQNYLEESLHSHADKAFYFFKMWMIESQVSVKEIDDSYLIHIVRSGEKIILDLRFPDKGQVLQFNIFVNSENRPVSGLFLPISSPEFSADYNNDGLVNEQDVLLARQR